MNRFLFFIATLLIGIIGNIFCQRYLSFYGVGPQILLLIVLANGFLVGPLSAVILGFLFGILSDTMGLQLFGMNSLLLPLAGYVSGKLRRRVASERLAAQVAVALLGTLFYALGVKILLRLFEPDTGRSVLHLISIGGFMNVLVITAIFWAVERWVSVWNIAPEQV